MHKTIDGAGQSRAYNYVWVFIGVKWVVTENIKKRKIMFYTFCFHQWDESSGGIYIHSSKVLPDMVREKSPKEVT